MDGGREGGWRKVTFYFHYEFVRHGNATQAQENPIWMKDKGFGGSDGFFSPVEAVEANH
jgi:hypothetical protein